MRKGTSRWLGTWEAVALPVALVLALATAGLFGPAPARSTGGVQLLAPETVHSNGAELRWTPFDTSSGTFSSYEVHRSTDAGFTPSSSTLLTRISDVATTAFRDTSAAPSKSFTYKIVANGTPTGAQTVALPAAGQARKTLQPIPVVGQATYVEDGGAGAATCPNHGGKDSLRVGAEPGSTARALLSFDLSDVPARATVSSATLSLHRSAAPATGLTVDVHRITRSWKEGTGSGDCTGDGANWLETEAGVPWETRGGDHDGSAVASKALGSTDGAGWDAFDVGSAAQTWANGDSPNLGLMLKARDEGAQTGKSFTYLSDDYADAGLRPKLVVEYADGSASIGPSVGVSVAGGSEEVVLDGTETLRADAADDRRVDKVEFLVDGAVIATDTSAPFEAAWDTTSAADGTRTISARATDDVGNRRTSTAEEVAVENSAPPTAAITSPVNSYVQTVKNDGPAAYWRVGETSGTTAADSSGNNRPASYGGTYTLGYASLLTGDADKAVRLTENNNKDGALSAGLSGLFGSSVSAEAIVDYASIASSGAETRIVSRYWGSSGGWLLSVQNSGGVQKARFAINAGGTVHSASANVTPGRRHLVGTYDGSAVRLHVDGAEVASVSVAGASLNTSATVWVGDQLAASTTFDEVALYDKALTADQANAHFEVGKGRAVPVKGTTTLTADAADDKAVERVEFLVDGVAVAEDASAPYSASWNTLDPDQPTYNGAHKLTAVAYDAGEHATTSAEVAIDVANAGATKYVAELASTPAPQSVIWDPAASTQDKHGLDVTVTNRSNSIWSASDVVLRPRWVAPEGAATGIADGPEVALGSDLAPGASRTVRMLVEPPALPDGVDKAQYTLRVDAYSKSATTWFADKGSKPLDNPVIVNRALMRGALGLERYYHYVGEDVGGGMQHLANVANGNSLLRITPFEAPGRGLSTVLDITYNSLEKKSESPIGPGFSLSISGLTRFGNPIDIHPNRADEIAGRANRFVELTDGDGTTHRFTGKQAADGTVYWEEPDGVHLHLHSDAGSTERRWVFTRPDRVQFFYDVEGYPTAIRDRNGNEIRFTLEDTPPSEDPGGPKKRIVKVTDAAGNGATPAPNRSFAIEYYSKAQTKKAHVRGKVRSITDHNGSRLGFLYYDDGNLRRLIQVGGTKADGSFLAGKKWYFSYTTSSGDGPAIASATDRKRPPTKVSNQSTRLFGVVDPRGFETTFAYVTSGQDRWKLVSRTDRLGHQTTFAYDTTARVTTVSAPEARVSRYAYDTEGKVVSITNPKDEVTRLEWTDRHVTKVTEPTGRFTTYAYNANGMLKERNDQLGNRTLLEYEDLPVPGPSNDAAGYWKPGRTIPHVSQLKRKTDPKGAATADPSDYQWVFDYDPNGNVKTVTDPEEKTVTHDYNADGTLARTTDQRGNPTVYEAYDANGFATKVTDAESQVTRFGFDDDGLLRWVQDPRHAGDSGSDERSYRTYFDYDSLHRLERQSTPKSTKEARGRLIWSGVAYDFNDNVRYEHKTHEAEGWSPDLSLRNERQYDRMDRLERYYTRDKSVDTDEGEYYRYAYDAAGRVIQWTSPQGMYTNAIVDDHSRFLAYDKLDRVVREWRHEFDGATIKRTRRTHYCYDLAGDLRSVTAGKADLASVDCGSDGAPAGTPHTRRMTYDAAHQPLSQADPAGRTTSQTYDANGNVETQTNERGAVTTAEYDERNLLTKAVQPLEPGPTGRKITTAYEYDAAGNLEREISPRAWDASGDGVSFGDYVTKHVYDRVDRLVKTELPTGPDHRTQQYLHRAYDAGGNTTAISVGVEQSDASGPAAPGQEGKPLPAIPANKKTVVDYYDTGWVLRSNDPGNPPVRFDYTPEGWQTSRAPEKDGRIDADKELTWEYYLDGMLKGQSGRDKQVSSFTYDAGNRLVSAKDSIGASDEKRKIDLEVSWDTLDQPTKVRHRREGESNWTATTMAYDLNGNVERRVDDLEEATDGSNVKAGRTHEFTFDGSDWLAEHLDRGRKASDDSDDRRITNTFFETGWEKTRRIERRSGTSWDAKQTTTWDYHENGLLKKLETRNGANALVESHDISYVDPNDDFVNGHRTKDVFFLNGPKADAPCKSADAKCTLLYTYDPRDRLVKEERKQPDGTTKTTSFTLDAAGNVAEEKRPDGTRIVSKHQGQQLDEQTITAPGGGDSLTQYFEYDADGNLDCVTSSRMDCPTTDGHVANLLADYRYDLLNRLIGLRSWSRSGEKDDESRYVYDALDRVVEQTDSHGPANAPEDGGASDPRTSLFSYLGVSSDVASEERRSGEEATGTLLHSKAYSYDAFGNRVGMTRTKDGGDRDYTYGYDVHGSVSLLLDEQGVAKAQYGYTPYGERDKEMTEERDPDNPDAKTKETDPLNSFRYTGKRLDPGSGTIDMGARRFGPQQASFLQEDRFDDALANLDLGSDPLTQNRYSLAGGNPVSFVETDGHMVRMDGGGGGSRSPRPRRRSSSGGGGSGSSGGSGGGTMRGGTLSVGGRTYRSASMPVFRSNWLTNALARERVNEEPERGNLWDRAVGQAAGFVGVDAPDFMVNERSQAYTGGKEYGSDVSLLAGAAGALKGLGRRVAGRAARQKGDDAAETLRGRTIHTSQGPRVQSMTFSALLARQHVAQGGTLYRAAGARSKGREAEFWTTEHPNTPGFAERYQIPKENLPFTHIQTATVRPGTDFVTTAMRNQRGQFTGGVEVVVPPGGVENFQMFKLVE